MLGLYALWRLALDGCTPLVTHARFALSTFTSSMFALWPDSMTRMAHATVPLIDDVAAWIPWTLAQHETAVIGALVLGGMIPVGCPRTAGLALGGTFLWFPLLLGLITTTSLNSLFTAGAPSHGVIVAFIMWLRGMISAGPALLSPLAQHSSPSWAFPPTLVLRRSYVSGGTDMVDEGSPGYAQTWCLYWDKGGGGRSKLKSLRPRHLVVRTSSLMLLPFYSLLSICCGYLLWVMIEGCLSALR